MATITPKRIRQFIKPYRVEPGRKVRLPRDFDPTEVTRDASKAEKKEALASRDGPLAEDGSEATARQPSNG